MANARELKQRSKSVSSTAKITGTMELVASAKMKKAQDAAEASRPYAEALLGLVARLSSAAGEVDHPLMEQRPVKKAVVLVASSDRGMCGAFNGNIVREAQKRIEALKAEGAEVEVIGLAKKAGAMLRFNGVEIAEQHSGLIDGAEYEKSAEIIRPLTERFLAGDVDRVEVVYARFESAARQTPSALTLLPAGQVEAEENEAAASAVDVTFEPDPASILEALIPQTVRTLFYSALLQTAAGEHAARRVAMKNATDAAKDLAKMLNRFYNRARQGKITQEIAEIVGAVEAMA